MKNLMKRTLTLLLAFTLCVSMLQLTAFAEEVEPAAGDPGSAAQELGETPEVTPEETPEEAPETAPGGKPGETPEATPEKEPGETPGGNPEENPETNSDQNPEEFPGESTVNPRPGEIPDEVQAFLDAVAGLPDTSEITSENVEDIGIQVGAVFDLYEAISGENSSRGDVAEALETAYAVFKAVLDTAEIEDGGLYSRTSNVTKSPYQDYAPNTPGGSDLKVPSDGFVADKWGTVALTADENTATDYVQVRYYAGHGGAYATGYSFWYSNPISSNPSVATATQSVGTLNGRPCIVVNFKAGTQKGTTTITVSYLCENLCDEHGISVGDYYHVVQGDIKYTVTNNGSGTTVTPGDRPTDKPVVNPATMVHFKCTSYPNSNPDSYTNNKHALRGSLKEDLGPAYYSLSDIVPNDGTDSRAPADENPWMCVLTLNNEECLELYNQYKRQYLNNKTHYLAYPDQAVTLRYYYDADGWYSFGADSPLVIWMSETESSQTTYKVTREYYIDGARAAKVTGAEQNGKVGQEIAGAALAADNSGWNTYTIDKKTIEFEYIGCEPDPKLVLGTDAAKNVITLRYEKNTPKNITGIEKTLVESVSDTPDGVDTTGITFPNTDGKVILPADGTSVTLLYRITVTGDAGAKYNVADTGASWVSGPKLGEENTIPASGSAVIYVTKSFTKDDIADGRLLNTATITPGKNGESSSSSTETTPAEEETNKYTYTLTYHENGDSVSSMPSPNPVTEADTTAASHMFTVGPGEPTRDGYTFTAWNTKADGSGDEYRTGDRITADTGNKNLHLYAQWEEGEEPPVDPNPPVEVTKTVDKTTGKVGETVNYTVTITNRTGADLTVKVDDVLPAGLKLGSSIGIKGAKSASGSVTGTGTVVTPENIADILAGITSRAESFANLEVTIEAGKTATLTYSATVQEGAAGTLTNKAAAVTGGKEYSDTASVTVEEEGPKPPQPVEYKVTVKYQDELGNAIEGYPDAAVATTDGGKYDVTGKKVSIDGYTFKEVQENKPLEGTVTGDTTIVLVYTKNPGSTHPEPTEYTVRYFWTGLPADAPVTPPETRSYAAGDQVAVDTGYARTMRVTVGGRTYIFSGWNRSGSFEMPAQNVTITGSWSVRSRPDRDDRDDGVEIEDDPVPLASLPPADDTLVEIPDEAVPLAGLPGEPDTGAKAHGKGLWTAAVAASLTGLFLWLRKDGEDVA